ncbi:hypothetical protein D9758_018199 [Tetrapyrgos nigripes]|uniref:HAT C-terminal dimerisation domain-containing protein n=1 Tax=Tetrapyrgos nigripes TaxID=182062 RepID=A0A8H5F9Z7_9AGAR|nr:hypothetical protein D9758_018199 [Tetrapyrgos nigripes]
MYNTDELSITGNETNCFSKHIPAGARCIPVQASAVPCERAFSSSKETDADRRSRLDPVFMEVLRILKAMYHEDRLNFTKSWVATTPELGEEKADGTCTMDEAVNITMTDMSREKLKDMLINGQIQDIARLINASYGISPAESNT